MLRCHGATVAIGRKEAEERAEGSRTKIKKKAALPFFLHQPEDGPTSSLAKLFDFKIS